MNTQPTLRALRDELDQARTDDPLTLMNIVADLLDIVAQNEADTHTALIALQDRLAALDGAQTETERRLAALERIARLSHAERQTYRAWQESEEGPIDKVYRRWPAYKAARAALDGALESLSAK